MIKITVLRESLNAELSKAIDEFKNNDENYFFVDEKFELNIVDSASYNSKFECGECCGERNYVHIGEKFFARECEEQCKYAWDIYLLKDGTMSSVVNAKGHSIYFPIGWEDTLQDSIKRVTVTEIRKKVSES